MIFVAIDFETADQKRDSACAIGLCRVENGRIVYREAFLIRPPRGMHPINQGVHGLSYDDVKDAPSFAQVWAKALPILTGADYLVAHNASFDRSVLRACLCVAKLPEPTLPWECTLKLAREKCVGLASHKLPDVCRWFGIEFTNHHEAGADAEAAAIVYLKLTDQFRDVTKLVRPDGGPESPAPQTEAWAPSGECGEILDEIPAEFRTPAAIALMRDAAALGRDHCHDLVRTLGKWFAREEPGRPRCRVCTQRCGLLVDLCTECVAGLPG